MLLFCWLDFINIIYVYIHDHVTALLTGEFLFHLFNNILSITWSIVRDYTLPAKNMEYFSFHRFF